MSVSVNKENVPTRVYVIESAERTAVLFRRFGLLSKMSATLILGILFFQPLATVFAAQEADAQDAPAVQQPVEKAFDMAPLEPEPVPSVAIAIDDGPSAVPEAESGVVDEDVTPLADEVPETVSVGAVSEDVATEEIAEATPDANVMPLITDEVLQIEQATTTELDVAHENSQTPIESEVSEISTSTVEIQSGNATADVPPASESGDTPVAESSEVVEPVPEVLSESTDSLPLDFPEDVASDTPEVTVEQPESNTSYSNLNRYQFGVNECVAVEDGFFYCTKNTSLSVSAEDHFYSAQDQDGDFEIFLSKDGVDTQITHNLNDDSAPNYDPDSETLVWHSLINDRYQIMRYDLAKNELTQLTDDPYNNMEPVVSGDRIVWQAWIDGNWEIMLDEAGERTQLTHNSVYDIDPHVRDNLASWQTLSGDVWHVEVLDFNTGHVDIMEGAGDGASIENPRFVLLYDSKQANGDIETKGYDLAHKKVIPLAAIPTSAPRDIPVPEHSKDDRALVQIAPNLKEEITSNDDHGTTTPSMEPPPENTPDSVFGTSTASTTVPGVVEATSSVPDLIVEAPTVSEELSTSTESETIPALDLRIAVETPTVSISEIPDLVISAPESVQEVATSTLE